MSKVFSVLGIIAGAVLIILSFFIEVPNVAASNIKVPSREINNPTRYIGGDAYNYQIEASLLGGEIAGASAAKATSEAVYFIGKTVTRAIYFVGGVILLFGSFIALGLSIKPQ